MNQPQVNQRDTQPQVDNNRSDNFLVQYLEKMKADLSKSMDERLERIENAFQARVVGTGNPPQPTIPHQLTPQQLGIPTQTTQPTNPTPREAYHQMQQHPLNQYPHQVMPVAMNQLHS